MRNIENQEIEKISGGTFFIGWIIGKAINEAYGDEIADVIWDTFGEEPDLGEGNGG